MLKKLLKKIETFNVIKKNEEQKIRSIFSFEAKAFEYVSNHRRCIFNRFIDESTFPDIFKLAKASPFKKTVTPRVTDQILCFRWSTMFLRSLTKTNHETLKSDVIAAHLFYFQLRIRTRKTIFETMTAMETTQFRKSKWL